MNYSAHFNKRNGVLTIKNGANTQLKATPFDELPDGNIYISKNKMQEYHTIINETEAIYFVELELNNEDDLKKVIVEANLELPSHIWNAITVLNAN